MVINIWKDMNNKKPNRIFWLYSTLWEMYVVQQNIKNFCFANILFAQARVWHGTKKRRPGPTLARNHRWRKSAGWVQKSAGSYVFAQNLEVIEYWKPFFYQHYLSIRFIIPPQCLWCPYVLKIPGYAPSATHCQSQESQDQISLRVINWRQQEDTGGIQYTRTLT